MVKIKCKRFLTSTCKIFLTLLLFINIIPFNIYAEEPINADDDNTIDYSSILNDINDNVITINDNCDHINDMINNFYSFSGRYTFDLKDLYFSPINNYFLRDDVLINWFDTKVFNNKSSNIIIWINTNLPYYLQYSTSPTINANGLGFISWDGINIDNLVSFSWSSSVSLENARILYFKVNNQIIYDGVSSTYNSFVINSFPSLLSNLSNSSNDYSSYLVAIFVIMLFLVFRNLIWGV